MNYLPLQNINSMGCQLIISSLSYWLSKMENINIAILECSNACLSNIMNSVIWHSNTIFKAVVNCPRV